ncbi:F-box-like protein [Rhizoctonia solani AG-3 Rhs1AP]|uniref:F-box-like protein n=1 Tax=Rhizoctonia solani AG-3 Rhs1AP TaxID=1086054 RepID=A0A0A1UI75_9AGAM|nr:F-box-like protein [Rhizoctonia solani AG-3 Rhs1AP]
MPKRPHSPSLDSVFSVKYPHNSSVKCPNQWPVSNFDTILSDETVLGIFAFLDPYHLCLVQLVNKHWSRLATDNHLWRIMFLREFSRSRLRGSRGFIAPTREIKPLPSRAQLHGEEYGSNEDLPENYTDWRWMFRISSNWSRGRCTATVQRASPRPAITCPRSLSSCASLGSSMHSDNHLDFPQAAHVLLVGDLTIYASSQTSPAPTVYIFRDNINSGMRIQCDPPSGSSVSVTTLCLDHSSARTRLAIFYSDHSWTIRTVDYERRHVTTDYTSTLSRLGSTIVGAAFHHPLLVTLSSTFRMCIYHLQTPPATPVLKQTLSSYSGFTPLTMTIARYRAPDQYRILLAHASPIYPAHWGPSVTDITISAQPSQSDTLLSMPNKPSDVRILSSSSTSNQFPVGWIPDGTPDGIPEELRLRWLRKVSHVSGIQTDGKFVVFASEDGGIQVYRLLRNARLLYERTLFPPTHAPSPRALSVADSRCVCATGGSGLWVWDLESGVGIQATAIRSTHVSNGPETSPMAAGSEEMLPNAPPTITRVAFDAHKIVAVDVNNALHTYSFDT